MEREKLSSRLGFILLSAGCAIGCGNVWKFPYMASKYGGGAFVLIYLIFLVLLGLPVLTMEFSIGRASKASPVRIYHTLTPEKKPWRIHGYLSLVGSILLMMFYCVVAGWMLYYFFAFLTGQVSSLETIEESVTTFNSIKENPLIIIISTALIVFIGFFICSFKLDKGLEKVTKVMMIFLLFIMIALAIYSFFLSGAKEGLKTYLVPSLKDINFNVIVAAMSQAFFTLSLGIGCMAIFGSYIDKKKSLLGESLTVIILDTFVALTAGLIIFPARATYECSGSEAGPGLLFETLPLVFNHIKGGRIFATFFFLFMTFAAFSTVLAVFENIIACLREIKPWSRKKACLIGSIGMFILTLPCVLSFCLFKTSYAVLDIEDFLVSNLLLPLGSLVYVFYTTTHFGWGWGPFFEEANTGNGLKIKKWMKGYCTFILPFIILALLIIGLITYDYQGDIFSFFG